MAELPECTVQGGFPILLGVADMDTDALGALLDSVEEGALHAVLCRLADEAANPTGVPYAAFASSM